MKAIKLVILSSILFTGLSAFAADQAACPHVADGQKISRDDRFANPNTAKSRLNSALPQASVMKPASGQKSKVSHN